MNEKKPDEIARALTGANQKNPDTPLSSMLKICTQKAVEDFSRGKSGGIRWNETPGEEQIRNNQEVIAKVASRDPERMSSVFTKPTPELSRGFQILERDTRILKTQVRAPKPRRGKIDPFTEFMRDLVEKYSSETETTKKTWKPILQREQERRPELQFHDAGKRFSIAINGKRITRAWKTFGHKVKSAKDYIAKKAAPQN